jgi:glycolate oxidase FAD binding subunit
MKSIPFDLSLRDALGDRMRVLPAECARYAVSGIIPKSVALPAKAQEAALALKAASAEGASVVIRGAGTKMHRAPPPRAVDVVLDLTACAGIIEHAASDLTVTVGGATKLADLESALARAGQFWPCDAPFAQSATVGGTIAANAVGALRQGYGAVRDLLLGANAFTADGTAVRMGARVVKSVAGYDTHKLLVGSYGTLAAIVEATLKVAPLPETERSVVARFPDAASAVEAAIAIARSSLWPMATTLHDGVSARRVGALLPYVTLDQWILVSRFGGNRRSVSRQSDGIVALCRSAGAQAASDLDGAASPRAWAGIRELAGGDTYPVPANMVLKIVALPTDVAEVLHAARSAWPRAELTSHPANGVAFVHVPFEVESFNASTFVEMFGRCARSGWTAAVLAAPHLVASQMPETPPPSSVRLIRAVKAAFDRAGVLDPGRLAGGV